MLDPKRVLAMLAVLWFGLLPAMRLGSAWNSSVFPARDVRVTLHDGTHVTGDLSSDWRGDYTLRGDGEIVRFRMDAAPVLEFPRPKKDERGWGYVLSRWRTHLPPLLLLATAFCLPFVRMRPRFREGTPVRSSPEW